MNLDVVWHEVECHAYRADLEVWLELAAREGGPVLDIGAGTGRVASALATAGHRVVALDRDPGLLAELRTRRPDIATVVADAQSFCLEERFGLVVVPMQTVQLLDDRPGFFAAASAHLRPGGLLAVAISEEMQAYDGDPAVLPDPDTAERDGWRFLSQPTAVLERDGVFRIERVRTAIAPGGERTIADDVIELAVVSAADLVREAAAAGLRDEGTRDIPATEEHVGSTVVMFRG